MAVSGSSPQAAACAPCARPISPPSAVTTELLLIFIALNGATETPRRCSQRQSPAVTTLFPASELAPATRREPRTVRPGAEPNGPGGPRVIDRATASRTSLVLL